MSYFKPVNNQPDFVKDENSLLAWWQKNDIVSLYLHKNDQNKKRFSFIDGPITANGPMGVHHARGRTLKDVFQRYKNAQGFAQRFQNGFDCQGLWVEVEVEKELGFNSKKDIIDYGLAEFTQKCLDRVDKFSKMQTNQSQRLGMFMDWDNSYYTNSKTNNLYIWYFLKKIHQNGWLYKKEAATTWCPRCETGLSQHEQADGYQTITDQSVYLKFKILNRQNEYLLAWTTTPWTLSANVLLAINITHDYVKVKHDQDTLYLAKQSADRLGLTDQQKVDPNTLLNLEYESVYDIPAQKNIKHYVVNWDLVDPQEGTGIVHIAPGCGQEDFELGTSLNSDCISPLDSTGHFVDGFGDLSGKYAHDVSQQVFDHLTKTGSLFKTEPVSHRYPHCWRCKTKCLFRLQDNWFIKCDDIRPRLKKHAQEANWIPKYVSRRMQNWLDNMGDWMISRNRFYGLALPFYECKNCHQLTVIGSLEELKKLAVEPQKVDQLTSLHRPHIDQIAISCPHCHQTVTRISDVGDCWLDAGVVPFSTLKYLEDKNYWQKWFPAEFVSEMTEQVRLWFYSLLFFSVVLEDQVPYQNVLNYNEVRDEKGERMSKTKKNGIPFDQAVEKMSADAMRWLYCQQKSHQTVNFGYTIADQVKRGFLFILFNSYRYFINSANNQSWQPSPKLKTKDILDDWILSRLNHTIKTVTQHLNRYKTSPATAAIEQLVNDISTWYIRRNRTNPDALPILHHCLSQISLLIAPFTPFLAETLWTNLSRSNQSVHLQDWPKYDPTLLNSDLEQEMDLVRQICTLIHQQRQINNLKVRQPLSSATIITNRIIKNSTLNQIIKDETNIKKITWQKTNNPNTSISLDTTITKELEQEGQYRDLLRNIQVLRKELNLKLTDKISITSPNWPKDFEAQLLEKTLSVSIKPGNQLSIVKVDD